MSPVKDLVVSLLARLIGFGTGALPSWASKTSRHKFSGASPSDERQVHAGIRSNALEPIKAEENIKRRNTFR